MWSEPFMTLPPKRIVLEVDDDLAVVTQGLMKFYGLSAPAVTRVALSNLHRSLELHKP